MANNDSIHLLGKIIDSSAERDAVHIAIAPVTADCILYPGEHIGTFNDDKATKHTVPMIGIVDPFLTHRVEPGDMFFMFLYPGTITSLRHRWTHPSFEDSDNVEVSENEAVRWLTHFADGHTHLYDGDRPYTYDDIIEAATEYLDTGYTHTQRGGESLQDALESDAARREFWYNYEIATGRKVPETVKSERPFSCAC